MKKSILTYFLIILTTFLYGQKIKISVAPTINVAPHYQLVAGGPGQNIKAGLAASFEYLFLNDNKVNFGFGLNYHYSQVEFVPNLNSGEMVQHTEKLNLISIRLKTLISFKKSFYLSLDPSIDYQTNYEPVQVLNDQSGIGLSLGFGRNIKLKESLFLNIEPKIWIHNIIPFNIVSLPYLLTTTGLNLGLVFGQKKLTAPG
jgi:hypothetical protein